MLPWSQPLGHFVQFLFRCIKIVLIINQPDIPQDCNGTYLQQLETFVRNRQPLHVWQMAKQQFVDLFQNLERGALHPFVRRLVPPFLNAQVQKPGFGSRKGGERAGT